MATGASTSLTLTLPLTRTLPLSLPLTLCRRFYFQAQGMPRPAMWNNLAFVLINAGLNWTFVFGGPFQYAPIGWHGFGFVGARLCASWLGLGWNLEPQPQPQP